MPDTPQTENCVNCGDPYEKGTGFPLHDGGKWECCCSEECFTGLCGAEPGETLVYIPFKDEKHA